ncbi:sigma-54-dependent Fis family transcriptional regulator [Vibrio aquaticus]|uniref:Sigma-54-dependent Fis family transcriptional regulator n=1 Tax=Vibrio aquaticus TaxID=2496559 RepID=A0A432D2L1_9VIBR|nr:sigma-54 dependent transcriptional regulator [Vibrio aquaticus]RTZ18194.1 sigma-54-dependent Fis family transcriptional regulator [Vibrio aquaticus]
MREQQAVSILVISRDHTLWSGILSEQGWGYRIVASIDTAKEILKNAHRLVVVFDFSCGRYQCEQLEALHGFGAGVRTIAYLDKSQKERLTSEELTYISYYCVDYYTSPLPQEMVLKTLGHQVGMLDLKTSSIAKTRSVDSKVISIIGNSPSVHRLRKHISKVSPADVNTLICGESGTGKELVARAIHDASSRAEEAFVAVNCGALNEQLIHSELFGHEKGAFTGASSSRRGKIASAHNGTLFLDEIGDLPLTQQANLLRFLQEGTIDVLGGSEPVGVNVRVVAATHVDLEQAVKEGRFRQDLYFRLNVLRVNVPALRERGKDTLLLADYFMEKFSAQYNCNTSHFDESARQQLLCYQWPGNVRELINIVKRAVLMNEMGVISAQDLDIYPTMESTNTATMHRGESLRDALLHCDGNVLEASKYLGISRATAYRIIDKYDLKPALVRARSLN